MSWLGVVYRDEIAIYEAAIAAGQIVVTEKGDATIVDIPCDLDLERTVWYTFAERGHLQYHRAVDFQAQRVLLGYWRLK